MIPDAQLEEVRARADIVDIVGEVVALKRAGREYKGLCPFHDDRNPSLHVVPDKGFYICFSCGETGDVFSFVMKRLGLDFTEAIRHVAARSGVEIREVRGRHPEEDPHRPLYELNAFARELYRDRLRDPETGRRARDYLESRGVDMETADRFGLGYAPDDWRTLRDAAARHGWEDDLLVTAGLLTTSEKASEPYDRFRDRLVFPIEELGGRTVGFGGRVLGRGSGGPKYLNSPETPIYHKGEILYGLSWAKHAVRRESAALVVEGYMDVVALAAAGFENVVATLGTALTDRHAELLSRYTGRVHLLFDSDEAGLRATFRAGDTLLAAGVHPSAVTLPPGEDPDTLVRKEGSAGLRHHLDQAVDILDRKLRILEEKDWFRDIERTRGAVDRLLPTLRAADDPTLRDIYVQRVAERTGVRRETLEAELRRGGQRRRGGGRRRTAPRPGTVEAPAARPPTLGAERMVLHVLLNRPEWTDEVAETVGPDDFGDPLNRRVFQLLLSGELGPAGMEDPDPRLAIHVEELRGDADDLTHAGEQLRSSVAVIRNRDVEERLEELRAELRRTDEDVRQAELAREIQRLAMEGATKGANQGAAARAVLRHLRKGTQERNADD